jgi:hypothetical protein
MKLHTVVATLTIIWFASSAFANDNRLDPLLDSRLFSDFEERGEWQVTLSDSKIHYECLKCTNKVTANIEIITPYDVDGYTNYRDRYLAERTSFCAKIAQEFRGRCIGTDKTGWRVALDGFRSTHEFDDQLVTEIVFFYRNRYFGPVQGSELIKATIKSAKDAAVPEGTAEMLRWHMARLTTLY